ncbi:MAG: DNA-3-methyladenine glycosylase 2 family protein [Bacteroidota bacterium]
MLDEFKWFEFVQIFYPFFSWADIKNEIGIFTLSIFTDGSGGIAPSLSIDLIQLSNHYRELFGGNTFDLTDRTEPIMTPIVNQNDIDDLFRTDDIFPKIQAQYGTPPNWNRPQGFTTLAEIILEQQVSLQSANAHFNKLKSYLPTFTPAEILKLSDEEMRMCQISKQKSKYLRELSIAILDGKIDLKGLPELPIPVVRDQLKSIMGIGDWTTDIYLMFCLQSKDVFPTGDIAVINTIRELTNAETKDELIERSEKWEPYHSLATFFLWHYYLCKRKRSSGL